MRALTVMLFAAFLALFTGCGEQPPATAPASPPVDEAVGRWVLDPDATREATEVSLIEGRRGELEGVEGEENERLREMIRGQSSRIAEGLSRMGTRTELRADGTYLNREEEGSATGTWFRSGDRIRFVLDAGEEGSSSSRWEYEGFLKDGRLHVRPPAPLPVVVVLRRLLAGEEPGSSSLDPLDAEMIATDDPDELVLLLSGGSGGAGYWSARAADQKLAKMGARALPAIRKGLDSGNLYIRQQCTYRLGMLKAGAHAAVPHLIEMLAKDHHEVAWSAAVALGRIAPSEPEVVAALSQALYSIHSEIRMCAAEALGASGAAGAQAVPKLLRLLRDEDESVRAKSAVTLAAVGAESKELIPHLLHLLDDPEWLPRNAAVETLGNLGAGAEIAVPRLLTALRDESYMVRSSAAEAMGKIRRSGSTVLPALASLLADDSHGVRMSAINAIQAFGKEAEIVRKDLEKALSHEDWYTRTVAGEILDSF